MLANVKLGYFEMTLQLLNEDKVNNEKNQHINGSFGSVFDLELFSQVFALKSIEIKNK
jgi:hypothetical protein